jgi:hypothetical protein
MQPLPTGRYSGSPNDGSDGSRAIGSFEFPHFGCDATQVPALDHVTSEIGLARRCARIISTLLIEAQA